MANSGMKRTDRTLRRVRLTKIIVHSQLQRQHSMPAEYQLRDTRLFMVRKNDAPALRYFITSSPGFTML